MQTLLGELRSPNARLDFEALVQGATHEKALARLRDPMLRGIQSPGRDGVCGLSA